MTPDPLSQRAHAVLIMMYEKAHEKNEAVIQACESLISVLDYSNRYKLHIELSQATHNED